MEQDLGDTELHTDWDLFVQVIHGMSRIRMPSSGVLKVLYLSVVHGLSNKESAYHLGISVKTVEAHRDKARRWFGYPDSKRMDRDLTRRFLTRRIIYTLSREGLIEITSDRAHEMLGDLNPWVGLTKDAGGQPTAS